MAQPFHEVEKMTVKRRGRRRRASNEKQPERDQAQSWKGEGDAMASSSSSTCCDSREHHAGVSAVRSHGRGGLGEESDDEDAPAYVMEEYEEDDVRAMLEEQMDSGRTNVPEGAQRIAPVGKSQLDLRMDRLPTRSEPFEPPRGMMSVPTGRNNTGPKGVLADYEDAKRGLRIQRMFERINLERTIQHQVQPSIDMSTMVESKPADKASTSAKSSKSAKNRFVGRGAGDNDDDDDEDDDEDDEDAAAFDAYKRQRAAALQATLPVFGTYTRCASRGKFAELVKSVHENCYVVAHVYDNSLEACVRLHLSLEALCTQFTHVCFVRLRSTDAFTNFATAGLPALLVYRGGDMVSSAVRITDALPAKFTDLDVARLLQSKKILTLPTGFEQLEERRRQRLSSAQASDGSATTSSSLGGGGVGASSAGASSLRRSQVASLSDDEDDAEVDDLE